MEVFPLELNATGDALVARENKRRARDINPTIGAHRLSRQSADVRMDADDCNGRSYVSGSGDSSMEREFTGGLGGPSVSTPNSRHTSPSRSLSANSIKVELYSDEEPGRGAGPEERDEGPEPVSPGAVRLPNGKLKCDVCGMICIGPNVLMVHKRSHTGERPFQCNQCGASFTQKGNLLRHIKLHSGEKPFKCPFCNYACRRRDALTGHLRTHSVSSPTVGKPYKCSYCGRSYKQQSTLEEHRERCHSYLQSLDPQPTHSAHTQGEDLRDLDFLPDSALPPSADKMTFIDRLANSITKRKRSTPQKFVGEKHMRLSLVNAPYELSAGFDKEGDVIGPQHGAANLPSFGGVGGPYLGALGGGGGGAPDPVRPLRLPPPHPTCLSELTPVISSVYTQLAPLGPRMDCTGGGALSLGLDGHGEHGGGAVPPPRTCRPPSTPTTTPLRPRPASGTGTARVTPKRGTESASGSGNGRRAGRRSRSPPPPPGPASPAQRDALRVVDGEGRPVRSFRCEHCRVLFLDHVMFTIHMGCHGFRQPLECNICGHRSQDRYEFSSHIVRGEHKVG
ncbi:hypothetical protein SKAU_G00152260 [Synaphobranchus kaupii]|uniref:C2H2-type domain-containing protein n=1 Tax=Synaphobranchus kaupii TaxID=118154 RepID=A0A9Q1FH00_SYNKA|nr:hypothetical protein SKAU_G00152260 [Synaphobranchus kaupii]